MDDFRERWTEMYRARGVQRFVRDGAGPEYGAAPRRVLFVLKEPHGTEWDDVRDQLNKAPRGMWHTLARWAYGVLKNFPDYGSIGGPERKWALGHVAVVNLKKEGGGNKSDDTVLHAIAHRDRAILREQVEAIAPHVVIGCGTFDQLVWLLDVEPDPLRPHGAIVWNASRSIAVVPFRHPALSHGAKDYQKLKALIAPALT